MYISSEVAITSEPETNGWSLVIRQVGHILKTAGQSTCAPNVKTIVHTVTYQCVAVQCINRVFFYRTYFGYVTAFKALYL